MNQKVTLRFADHVLTFTIPKAEIADVKLSMRRKWLHQFTRGDGDFIVNFDQVLWMKISPGDDAEIGQETVEEQMEEYRTLFSARPVSSLTSLTVPLDGGEHGSL